MAMSDVRAAFTALLDGATATAGQDYATETLRAYDYPPPGGVQTALPCVYSIGAEEEIDSPPMMRHTAGTWALEVLLGGDDIEQLVRRRDAWRDAIASLADGAQALNGALSALTFWRYGRLKQSEYVDGWGFEIQVGFELYEAKVNAA